MHTFIYTFEHTYLSTYTCTYILIRIIDLCKTSINEAEIKNGEAAATPTEILAGLEIIDKFAVRTRVFDDFLRECILEKEFKQVCVIGAGLDTRPWRLLSTEENNSIKNLHYYEVDFEAMFAYKLPTLQEINATSSCGEYHSVAVDLSLPTWVDQLGASGFDTKKKTAWVLEGLTGYLTEEECTLMMTAITNRLSKKGSSMCASFVGLQSHSAISMHRFKTDVPLSYMSKLGWSGTQGDVIDFMKIYDRVAVVKGDKTRHGWDLTKGSQSIVKLVL